MDIMNGIVMISTAANFILAVLIFIHLRKSSIGRYLFWIIFGLSGWVLSNYFSNLDLNYEASLWINRLIFITTVVASWGFVLFANVFPGDILSSRKFKVILDCLLAIVIFVALTPFLISDIFPRGDVTDVKFGIGIYFYGIFVVGSLLYTIGSIVRKYFSEKYLKYREIFNVLVFAVSIFLVFASVTNLVLPIFFNIFYLTTLTPIYTSLFSFLIFWAILKHKFLNIKVIATELITFSLWSFIFVQNVLAKNYIDKITNAVLLVLVIIFGLFLIKSVRKEVQRKEELQTMADRLAVANDELRKLDNAKTEFISIASHQLRTPLTAIKGFISLILEGSYGEVNKDVHGALDKTYAATERLIRLVEDLLNISRIEAGRLEYKFEKADIKELIKELYDNFILIARTKKLALELKLPRTKIPALDMDRAKIREVLSNIIDNALKYTDKGGVTVRVEVIKEHEQDAKERKIPATDKGVRIKGDLVRVTVSDTGIGIPQEEMPYLFKKFSRGKDIGRLNAGGTGLGIYVGKSMMEAHHGRIWVESEGAGRGSSFVVELPL